MILNRRMTWKRHIVNTLTVTCVFKEVSVRPRVQQYQALSARCSYRYFNNANRSCDGLENHLSFRLFATLKPLAVVEYNEGKCGTDYSDQMVFYTTTIRKGIKWYRKLGIQLLLGISVVNALTVYKIATRKNINIRIFRQLLVAKLLGLFENPCQKKKNQKILVFDRVGIISPFGKMIPKEALDAHANYIMQIKDVEWTEQRHKRI